MYILYIYILQWWRVQKIVITSEVHRLRNVTDFWDVSLGSPRDPQGIPSRDGARDLSPMEKARRLGVYQWIPIIWIIIGIAMIIIGL